MIGNTYYWATGILLRAMLPTDREPLRWGAELKFYDDGFNSDDLAAGRISTQGTLQTRYMVRDAKDLSALPTVINTLYFDAERLGIQFRNVATGRPELYVDENRLDEYPPLTRVLITEQAERLGWHHAVADAYQLSTDEVTAARALPTERLRAMQATTLERLYRWHLGKCSACDLDESCPCEWADWSVGFSHNCNCSNGGWGAQVRHLARRKGVML